MQRVADRANNKVAQRNPNQIPDQHSLIVDQRASIKGHNPHHAGFTLINAHKCGKLEEDQKQRRRAEDLPKHALKHQVGVTVRYVVPPGCKYFIPSPTQHYRYNKVRNY